MMIRRIPMLIVTVAILIACCGPAVTVARAWPTAKAATSVQAEPAAPDFEFEFFYQRLESVATQSNRGAANAARNAVARLKQHARTQEGLSAPSPESITLRSPTNRPKWFDLFRKRNAARMVPAAGTDEITSYDQAYKYRVTRTRVTSEEQLLELMGARGDPSKLTDGQKCLLEIFRVSKQQNVMDAMKKGFRKKVTVLVTDTNGFEGDNITRDFWPCSTGDSVQFGTNYFNTPNNEQWARSVFVHEIAHSTDKTEVERDQPYGPDGVHYNNERTRPRVALSEGWAEFNQMYYYPIDAERIMESVKEIRIETSNGSYTTTPATEMSGTDLMRVEGINAVILYKMAKELPDGLQQVYRAFTTTNRSDRKLSDLINQYLADHPDQFDQVVTIMDEATFGRLTDAEFRAQLGNRPALTDWLTRRAERRAAAASAASSMAGPEGIPLPPPTGTSDTSVSHPVEVQPGSDSPFGE